MAFSPDGRRVAVSQLRKEMLLFDVASGKKVLTFTRNETWKDSVIRALAFSPDGRWLVSGDTDEMVRLWDPVTGREVLARAGHTGPVVNVAFAPDLRAVLSAALDGTALAWNMRPRLRPVATGGPAELWQELVLEGTGAYQALWALADHAKTAAFLGEKFAPARAVTAEQVRRWIDDLDSDSYAARTAAMKGLGEMGRGARPALVAALTKAPSREAEARLRELLDGLLREPAAEEVPAYRAVQVLELSGTKEARKVLLGWSKGAAGARLTEDARAALGRLRRAGRRGD